MDGRELFGVICGILGSIIAFGTGIHMRIDTNRRRKKAQQHAEEMMAKQVTKN